MTPTIDRLRERIADSPLLDHHCHAPLRLPQRVEPLALRAPFTESADEQVQHDDVPETIVYRAMIRSLAGLLGCAPTEHAVLETRAGYEVEPYSRLLADDAGLGPLYADYLFAQEASYTPEEWAALTGRPVRTLLRIEVLAQTLIPDAVSWEDFRQSFVAALAASRPAGGVGFKSIAAYRCGLAVQRVDAASASVAFDAVRAELAADGPTRLTDKTLIDALIWETLEVAAELQMPIQFHVGLGDDDVFLPRSNPVLLRAIFQEPRYRGVPIVLLHCYPYVREAAYLASIYPNAYVDLGLTFPLASASCPLLLQEALGLAPASKVLASTDGHGVPEFQWFTARLWRKTLIEVLAADIDRDLLDETEAIEIADMVMHANSERIYPT